MESLWGWEVAAAVNGVQKGGKKDALLKGVSTDTRHLKAGELFIALKGNNFDGHDFVPRALELGAAGVLISREIGALPEGLLVVQVEDTLEALGMLARYYREKLPAEVIAVTGTNGKTTTKEILHHLLSPTFRMVSSPGNFNNSIGVPLSLFQLEPYHELAVVEMGTSAPGEIRRLSCIARPDIGVLTNISEAHLEGLGSMEGVAASKAELLEGISPDGALVFNSDNLWCQVIAKGFSGRRISFGIYERADIKGEQIKKEGGGLTFTVNRQHKVWLPTLGLHNVYNALAALAVGYCLGLNIGSLSQGLRDFSPPPMRMERHRTGGITIINDAYNANPRSVDAALAEYSRLEVSGRKFFICGDMAELGSETPRFHHDLGQRIAKSGVDFLLLVGRHAHFVAQAARAEGMPEERVLLCDSHEALYHSAVLKLKEGDSVLLKGSRCMRLEEVCEQLKEHFSSERVVVQST